MLLGGAALLLVGAALPAPAAAADPAYILAGQSNMSGRGAITDLLPDEVTPDSAIRLFGNDGQWRTAAEPLDDATGQLDAVSADRQAAVGPGLFFAHGLRADGAAGVALIPCAKGGVSIRRWKPAPGRDSLYGSCLARVADSGAAVSGILWYQGESDTQTQDDARRWGKRFRQLVKRLRRDLRSPRLPVVYVQLSDPARDADKAARYPGWARMQQAQAALRLRCAAMVSAIGLTQKDDQLHLATAGQRLLGARMAHAMQGLHRAGCS